MQSDMSLVLKDSFSLVMPIVCDTQATICDYDKHVRLCSFGCSHNMLYHIGVLYRGSYMSGHVLFNLIKRVGEKR